MSFKTLSASVVGLCNRVFGQSMTYMPNGGSNVSISGVFDNAWVEIEGTMSLKPVVRMNLSDLVSAPAKGDRIQIDSVIYKIMESRPDGHGGTSLILQKA